MWPERKPTNDECSSFAEVSPPNDKRFAFAAWMPQVGGYCSPCVVSFPTSEDGGDGGFGAPGCFDVEVFHDGDMPRDERTCTLHFCDAAQLVRFAVDVLRKMGDGKGRRRMSPAEREALIDLVRTVPAAEE